MSENNSNKGRFWIDGEWWITCKQAAKLINSQVQKIWQMIRNKSRVNGKVIRTKLVPFSHPTPGGKHFGLRNILAISESEAMILSDLKGQPNDGIFIDRLGRRWITETTADAILNIGKSTLGSRRREKRSKLKYQRRWMRTHGNRWREVYVYLQESIEQRVLKKTPLIPQVEFSSGYISTNEALKKFPWMTFGLLYDWLHRGCRWLGGRKLIAQKIPLSRRKSRGHCKPLYEWSLTDLQNIDDAHSSGKPSKTIKIYLNRLTAAEAAEKLGTRRDSINRYAKLGCFWLGVDEKGKPEKLNRIKEKRYTGLGTQTVYTYDPTELDQIKLNRESGLSWHRDKKGRITDREFLLPKLETSTNNEFVPNFLQQLILKALDGKALTKLSLANKVCCGDGRRLYKPGGINELMKADRIKNKKGIGYYRPDSPPLVKQ